MARPKTSRPGAYRDYNADEAKVLAALETLRQERRRDLADMLERHGLDRLPLEALEGAFQELATRARDRSQLERWSRLPESEPRAKRGPKPVADVSPAPEQMAA